MKSIPALSWLGLKTRPSSTPNKNNPGRSFEQAEALKLNETFVPTPVVENVPATDFAPPAHNGEAWTPIAEVPDGPQVTP